MLKRLSNFFGRNSAEGNVAPKPEWLPTEMQDAEDSLSRQAVESIQDLKCFLADGKLIPTPGGLLIQKDDKNIGAIGVTGDTSDQDELCAITAIEKLGFKVGHIQKID